MNPQWPVTCSLCHMYLVNLVWTHGRDSSVYPSCQIPELGDKVDKGHPQEFPSRLQVIHETTL